MLKSRDGAGGPEGQTRVLLVDDEKEFVNTLGKRLSVRDFDVSIAYDGEQALAAVAAEPFDAMVLDLRMPGMDGIEVLQRIKEAGHTVEVVILTGHGAAEEERVARSLGAFAYLHKPADIQDLVRALDRAREKLTEEAAGA